MMRKLAVLAAGTLAIIFAFPTLARPQGELVRFVGQLLDVRDGYVYFTTGDAFKLSATLKLADYTTGGPTTLQPQPRVFARAILDPSSHEVVELDLTTTRLKSDATYSAVVKQSIATKPVINGSAPEIAGVLVTGKEVAVEFIVTVPPSTPIGDSVYIATDSSGWNPQAIKLDRIDGSRYRATRRLASGTRFVFRITRGTWNSVEVGQDGLEIAPHTIFVREVDAQSYPVTVYGWSDNRNGAPQAAQPGAIPTPFNPNPFSGGSLYPPNPRVTPPGGFPTARPGAPPNRPPR
jgi:hypothetical protein